jgi:hypothetical protein
MSSIFELGPDKIWNIAVVDLLPGINRSAAATALMRMGANVEDEIGARRLLNSLPKQVQVRGKDLEQFKQVFETAEWFHHERVIGDHKMRNRSVWVTLVDPDANPEALFIMAQALMMDERYCGLFRDCRVVKDNFSISFDRRP